MSDHAARDLPGPQPDLRAEFLRRAALFSGPSAKDPRSGSSSSTRPSVPVSRLPPRSGDGASDGPEAPAPAQVRPIRRGVRRGPARPRPRLRPRESCGRSASCSAEWPGTKLSTAGSAHGASTMDRARSLLPSVTDPTGDVWLAVIWTDVLLVLGAGFPSVEAAGREALGPRRGAGDRRLRSRPGSLQHHERADPRREARRRRPPLLGPEVERTVDLDRAPLSSHARSWTRWAGRWRRRPALQTLWRDARTRSPTSSTSPPPPPSDCGATAPESVVAHAHEGARDPGHATPVALLLPALVLAARAAADLAVADTAEAAQLLELGWATQRAAPRRLDRSEQGWATAGRWPHMVSRARATGGQGLGPDSGWMAPPSGADSGDLTTSAYCRWRAAQVALRAGRAPRLARLLNKRPPTLTDTRRCSPRSMPPDRASGPTPSHVPERSWSPAQGRRSSLTQRRAPSELTAMRMRTVIAVLIKTEKWTSAARAEVDQLSDRLHGAHDHEGDPSPGMGASMNAHRPTRHSALIPITATSKVERGGRGRWRLDDGGEHGVRVTAALPTLNAAAARRVGGGTRWDTARDNASVGRLQPGPAAAPGGWSGRGSADCRRCVRRRLHHCGW